MPVPKRKVSKSRRDKRSANKGLKVKAVMSCHNCSEAISPHQACGACGFYKGVKIFATKADRAVKRGKARADKNAKKSAAPKPAASQEAPEQQSK